MENCSLFLLRIVKRYLLLRTLPGHEAEQILEFLT